MHFIKISVSDGQDCIRCFSLFLATRFRIAHASKSSNGFEHGPSFNLLGLRVGVFRFVAPWSIFFFTFAVTKTLSEMYCNMYP